MSEKSNVEGRYDLISCIWELTLKCNMRCIHCGSSAGIERKKELTLDECLTQADELISLGCEELSFIGGEVFFYPGWERVARHLSESGVRVNIMTNGYRMNEDHLQQVRYAKLANVGVSIDGMEENHNTIRGKVDGFSEAIKTIDKLKEANIPVGVVTVLLDFNTEDLEAMYDLFVAKGVEIWQLQLANPMGNLKKEQGLIINPSKIPALTAFIREKSKRRELMILGADSIGYFDKNESYIRGRRFVINCWGGCQAGLTGIALDSVGNVKGCGALYSDIFIEGNVRERSLKEIWNDTNCFSYNRNFNVSMLAGECKDCTVGEVCRGGCRASNYFGTGSLYENMFCSRNQISAE